MLGIGEFSARTLRKDHEFTKGDIDYLYEFLETIQGKGLTMEEKRWLLIFKNDCFSTSDHVQLVPLIVNNIHDCFTVIQLGEYACYLPFFIERGVIKEGCIAGRQVYYFAKDFVQDKWFHEICAQFEDDVFSVTKFRWPASVSLTLEAKKVILNMIYNSDHVSLEQVYLAKSGNGWQLTASEPDPETFTTWFNIRLTSTEQVDGRRVFKADIPPVVLAKTGIDPCKSVFDLDNSNQVVLTRKAIDESPVTKVKVVSDGFRVTVPEIFRDHFFETPVYIIPQQDNTSFVLSRKKPEMGKVQEVSFRNKQIIIPPALKKSRDLRGKECLFILKGTKGVVRRTIKLDGGKVTFKDDPHEEAGIPRGRVFLQLHAGDSFTISHEAPFHETDLSGINVPGIQRFTVPFDFLKGAKKEDKCLFTAHGDKQFKVQVFDKDVHLEGHQVTEKQVLNKQKTDGMTKHGISDHQVTETGKIATERASKHQLQDSILKYQCDICGNEYNRKDNLERHKKSKHWGERYQCDICGNEYTQKDNLESHKKSKHWGERYQCDICGNEYTRKSNLENHKRAKHGREKYQCDICKKEYPYKRSLDRHKMTKHGREKYQCDICGEEYSHPSGLDKHRKVKHGGEKYQCDICKKEFPYPSMLEEHGKVKHGGEKYQCDICKKEFSYPSVLEEHKRDKHSGKLYVCQKCGMKTTIRKSFKRHLKYNCPKNHKYRIQRHEMLKRFMIGTFEEVAYFNGYDLVEEEAGFTDQNKKRIDIICKKGKKTVFIDVTATMSKNSTNKVIREKKRRSYQKYCDKLLIVVFNLQMTNLEEEKRKYETGKIEIVHYREIYKNEELLKAIKKIMRRDG